MSGPLVRRLRLPPADTSPARARTAVADLLAEIGLTEVAPEALLLTSELVTNAVMHAGTEVELELAADRDCLRVVVTDFADDSWGLAAPRALTAASDAGPRGDPGSDRDGGRGLLLVDHFASCWGTRHERGSRRVWFELQRPGAVPVAPSPARPDVDDPDFAIDSLHAALQLLAHGPVDTERSGPPTLAELVDRLGVALAAAATTVSVDRADGRGPIIFAQHSSDHPPADTGRVITLRLALTRPWTGELVVTGAVGRHADIVTTLAAGQMAVVVENQHVQEAHASARGWLLFLAHAGELLGQSLTVELTSALVPSLVVPRLGRWSAVHLANEYGELTPVSVTHADEEMIGPIREHLEVAAPALAAALAVDGVTPLGPPTDGMTVSLTVRGERLGTLTVGRPVGRPHQPDELAVIEDLGRRAAAAIENARIHDNSARIASAFQQTLLPPELPDIAGLDVAAQYVPAGNGLDVGGDFYDVLFLPDGGWLLVVGDVSGKGADAAAVTGMVRDVLHTLAHDYHDPEDTLHRLNTTLVKRGGGHFCTLALAFLAPGNGGPVDVALYLAGHDQPVLVHPDGATSLVGRCGTALGLVETVLSPRASVRLRPGDALVFYTDGVTERRRGSVLFGHQRLRAEISAAAGRPAAAIAARLRAAVLAYADAPPRDDIAIVALRAL